MNQLKTVIITSDYLITQFSVKAYATIFFLHFYDKKINKK